ncbi:hypothetical protein EVAR_84398_1 [Eumeta japonica]|uniref:Uncharacterized protein n=1 Tax=Eumeta variegata TaxID=151549 RepID=A0A4C1YE12_EUMVA|nr:hypothetical protein EVAR_84398_1 [Eumeta japonica]
MRSSAEVGAENERERHSDRVLDFVMGGFTRQRNPFYYYADGAAGENCRMLQRVRLKLIQTVEVNAQNFTERVKSELLHIIIGSVYRAMAQFTLKPNFFCSRTRRPLDTTNLISSTLPAC